jgi:hypothetical protein
LRAALIWHDEVMHDLVLDEPGPITLGADGKTTFVVPDLGLPPGFQIIRPGSRGYLLTLGEKMRGTISVAGEEHSVSEFVGRSETNGFAATAIGGKDWGVVDLDETGIHKLYFQFVPYEAPLPLAVLALELLMPALAFSVLLHAILLAVTYRFEEEGDSFLTWPGRRDLTGSYLYARNEEEKKPPEPKVASAVAAAPAASKEGQKENVKSATKGREGKAGGEGKIRAHDPNAKPDETPKAPPKVAIFEDRNRRVVQDLIDSNLPDLGNFNGLPGPKQRGDIGAGHGKGTGVGDDIGGTGTTRGSKGNGPGGGGSVEGDFVSQGKVDVGETRAPKGNGGNGSGVKEVAVVGTGTATGDFSGLSRDEIDQVVKKRAGLIRQCYQKQLDLKGKGLGSGKVVVHFVIDAGGSVTTTAINSSQVNDSTVEGCIRSQISRLKFPAKGGAIVNYPFIFNQG